MNAKGMRKRRERADDRTFRFTDSTGADVDENYSLPDEESWFKEARRVGHIFMGYMEEKWICVPHLRCVNLKERSRRMVSVCCDRVRKKTSGERHETVVFCLMVEDRGKDVTYANLQIKKIFGRGGERKSSNNIFACSCNFRRQMGVLKELHCKHRKVMYENGQFMERIRARLTCRHVDGDGKEEEHD